MINIRKGFIILLASGLFVGVTTCSAPRQMATPTTKSIPQIIYPSLTVSAPPTELIAEFPTPPVEVYKTDRKPVTTQFSAFDTHHVRSQDPLLFSDGNSMLIDLRDITEDAYAFPLPGSKVISSYGGRRRHSGVDLKTCANDTIVAAFDGVVRMTRPYAAYGNVIVIRHFNGLETVYGHNSRNLVKVGDRVRAGEAIALTGRTGRATTEHLHFEVRINGEHVNPTLFFDLKNRELRKKTFLCVRKNGKISVSTVDPFPYQENYLSYYY